MGCLEDESPDTILLRHGTNDLKSKKSAEKIASNINVTLSAKNKRNTVYVSELTVRNSKDDREKKLKLF